MSEVTSRVGRIATPRWLDARLVLGVVLVLLAVVVGARLFASAGRYTEVYVARSALVPGEHLAATDLTVGQVRFAGEGAAYVAAGSGPPVGYVVTRYLAAGELVPLGAVAATPAAAPTTRFVTVPVAPGHLPEDLAHGDVVDVYVTPKVGAGAHIPLPTRVLSAAVVESSDDESHSLAASPTVTVALVVPVESVPTVVRAAEDATLDLVRVPSAAAAFAPSPDGAPTGSPTARP